MVSNKFSVAVVVSDGRKSAKWFKEKVGLKASTQGHWVLVWPEGAGTKIHLCEGKPDPGNTGIAFYVKDPHKVAGEMKKKGVKFTKVTDDGPVKLAFFGDPDGNPLYLSESKWG